MTKKTYLYTYLNISLNIYLHTNKSSIKTIWKKKFIYVNFYLHTYTNIYVFNE
jgi:hypothetical protein